MGYFDGLTDGIFTRDAEGRTLIYPWGVLGRGYILPSEAEREKIRSLVKRMYMIMLPVIVLNQTLFGFWANLCLLPVFYVGYFFGVRFYTCDLEVSPVRLEVGESYRNSARSHNRTTLWALCAASVLFVIGGVVLMASGHFWLGLSGVIFFGLCTAAYVYMLRASS